MADDVKVVFLVMGNDFPEAVFSKEEDAASFALEKREKDTTRRIYWRVYPFTLR